MKKLVLFLSMLLTIISMKAQDPGELDRDFADNGVLKIQVSNFFDEAHCILVQPDNKIITVGRARMDGDNYSIYVSRHLNDGQPDILFGTAGIRTWRPQNVYANFATAAKLLDDGKIIISGYIYDLNSCHAFVARLNEDGSDDESFGNNGFIMFSTGYSDVIEDLEVQKDGKIVLAGYRSTTSSLDKMLVIRLLPNGQFDTSFGENGVTTITLPNTTSSFVFNTEIQTDGKILLFGTHIPPESSQRSVLVRINSNGSLDESFADEGVLFFNVGQLGNYLISGCVHPDGRILLGGHYWIANNPILRYGFYVGCLNPDGTFDNSFGNNGITKIEYDKTGANYFVDMKLSEDEKIFCLGYITDVYKYSDFVVLNLKMDGSLNEDFDKDGMVSFDFDGDFEIAHCAALQPDGKLLIGGWASPAGVYNMSDAIVARLYTGVIINLIENASKSTNFIYPNPTTDKIRINIDDNNCSYNLTVYNMMGHIVMTSKIEPKGIIDVSKLPAGNYLIQIVSEKQTLVNRFTKL